MENLEEIVNDGDTAETLEINLETSVPDPTPVSAPAVPAADAPAPVAKKRGRPRIHPVKDPNAPKKKPGRPKKVIAE